MPEDELAEADKTRVALVRERSVDLDGSGEADETFPEVWESRNRPKPSAEAMFRSPPVRVLFAAPFAMERRS